MAKTKEKIVYPRYICLTCGEQVKDGLNVSWHTDSCDFCGATSVKVAHVAYFGFPPKLSKGGKNLNRKNWLENTNVNKEEETTI